ncbi:MAG: CBS domain-containing protein [Alphaproteobacteria bacterium]|nr:CBS domain-containing protein [Alphaproteobacteria bacterium]
MTRKIRDAFRRRDLVALAPEATVRDAAMAMKQGNCGSVLVIVEVKLVGIVTERDVINRVVAAALDPAATALAAVMTEHPDTIGPDDPVLKALEMMEDGSYRHLPVVERGQVLGVVSRRDFYGEEKAQLDAERRLWEVMG